MRKTVSIWHNNEQGMMIYTDSTLTKIGLQFKQVNKEKKNF